MAARYLAAGYVVYGEARNRDAAHELFIDQGLRWIETPREVAEAADIVMTSLPNDDVVESVASGPDGLLAGLREGEIWADLSTITPGCEPSAFCTGARRATRRTDARHTSVRKRPGPDRSADDHDRW